jgi:hypothetical protein
MRKRVIWTPNEVLDMAKTMFEAKFGANQQTSVKPDSRPTPVLLPKPIRIVVPKGTGVSISQIRQAQKAEKRRTRFNKKVQKNLRSQSRKLTAAMRNQIRAAKAAYRAAMRQQRAQAQAALQRAEAAKRAAEALRKQVEAARQWLEFEKARQRALNFAVKERIRKARACGFRLLSTFCSSEQEWGASCPLFGHIRGLAAAAAVIWAAEQAK